MALWKPLLGTSDALKDVPLHAGYVYWCTNDGSLHFDYEDSDGTVKRRQVNAKDAETICGVSLDEIKNYSAQADFNQTDDTKADFIKNKPTLGTLSTKDTVAKNDLATDVQESLNKANSAIQSVAGLATEDYVEEQISKIPTPDVSGQIGTHNTNSTAHSDIRDAIPKALSQLSSDTNHRTITDTERQEWNAKATTEYVDTSLTEATTYTDTKMEELGEGFSSVIYQMYGDDISDEGAPTIRKIASDEATTAFNNAKDLIDAIEVPNEIYVGDGEMPEGATIQILLDGSDEEQALKDELKEYIDGEIEKVTPVKGVDYFTAADVDEIVNRVYAKVADGNGVAY